jgi:DNA mismatch repair ATPase MutS
LAAAKKGDVGPGKEGFVCRIPRFCYAQMGGPSDIKWLDGGHRGSGEGHAREGQGAKAKHATQFAPTFGAAVLDLTTGSTRTYSGQAQGRSDSWTVDDVVQLLSVYPPKELLIYWSNGVCPEESMFRRFLGLPSSIVVHIRAVETLGAFSSDLVRVEYLQKIYSIQSLLPPRTYLGIRSEQEELALLFLLQFVEEHDPSRLRSFQRNEPWIPHTKLICGNHALTQLQLTSATNPMESVLGLFDKAISPMGKRAMKERLLRPYSEAVEIEARLKEVQEYIRWLEDKSKPLERQLRFMFDLPRLHRNVLCGLIAPSEFTQLFQTYKAIETIVDKIVPHTLLKEPFTQEQWAQYQEVFRTHVSEDKAQQVCVEYRCLMWKRILKLGQRRRKSNRS